MPGFAMLEEGFVVEFTLVILVAIRAFFRSRGETALEVLALRRQVAVSRRKRCDLVRS